MPTFSERYGYSVKPIQINNMSKELRNRIWNVYTSEIYIDKEEIDTNCLEEIMDQVGLVRETINNKFDLENNLREFRIWFIQAEWYKIYDFIEIYLSYLSTRTRKDARKNFNDVLSWENSGYRVIGEKVVPITNPNEMSCIEHAQRTKYSSVDTHFKKATELFSKRPIPDYENSIKESISAVEAICSIITGEKGKCATLGQTISKLEGKGVHIHPSMIKAYSALYGYTNDEKGIRHGGIDFANAPAEDAKYMLVSCSAFVNYLMEKWSKVSST